MERVFIDTNVIIDLLRGKEKVVTFFKRIELGDIIGFTNKVVFLETVHVYLILTTGEGPLNLRKKPELISSADLTPILEIFDILQILPIDPIKERDVVEIITKYGLLPNDALIVATCRYYGIQKIATFDGDFKRVDFLEVIDFK
jgi:predicted nucleic acid-binding protein